MTSGFNISAALLVFACVGLPILFFTVVLPYIIEQIKFYRLWKRIDKQTKRYNELIHGTKDCGMTERYISIRGEGKVSVGCRRKFNWNSCRGCDFYPDKWKK